MAIQVKTPQILGPQKIIMTAQTWATGAGHAAQSEVAYNLTGLLTRIDVIIPTVTGNTLAVAVTFRDQNSCIVVPDALCATLADGQNNIFLSSSNLATQTANFNPVQLIDSDITVSIDSDEDTGGTLQTLSVQVILYLEQL